MHRLYLQIFNRRRTVKEQDGKSRYSKLLPQQRVCLMVFCVKTEDKKIRATNIVRTEIARKSRYNYMSVTGQCLQRYLI